MKESKDWMFHLSDHHITDLETAVRRVRNRRLDLMQVTQEDFALPVLGPALARIKDEVLNGRGFVLIRGLPVGRYDIETAALAYWGIGAHFGRAVSQNAQGHLLGHVRDIGMDPANPSHRIYATNARQLFHTDSCDIVGLLCLRPAKSGGMSSIASSVTVFNEMLQTRPDLVDVLEQPFTVDRKGEIPEGKGPHYQMAVFHHYGGYLTTIYARDFIQAAQRFDDVPRLTDIQVAALDCFESVAERPDVRLDMSLEPGDMQFLHNHQILHARTAYEDYDEPERKRHLLRLWLCPSNGRPLPPVFAERYGQSDDGLVRGGIVVPGVKPCAPLDPVGLRI